jgi:hypothetical protein
LFRPLGINVYPLKVTGGLGKAINLLLVDFDPVGQADFFPFQSFRVFD